MKYRHITTDLTFLEFEEDSRTFHKKGYPEELKYTRRNVEIGKEIKIYQFYGTQFEVKINAGDWYNEIAYNKAQGLLRLNLRTSYLNVSDLDKINECLHWLGLGNEVVVDEGPRILKLDCNKDPVLVEVLEPKEERSTNDQLYYELK